LKGDLSGKQRDYISRIHGAAKMLLGVINDVLDFSKIEAGQMRLEETEFTLDEVLDNVSSVLLHRAQEKGLELQYVVEPGVPAQLLGDPLRLAQILVNLIGNALKFTASGSVSVYVRRLAADSDACVRLEFDVQDTGIGMSAEQQRNLFQAFSQADTSITRKFGGTGLGLAISKHLTELMGGDIRVSSQPRVGSTFSFTINLRPGRQPAAVVHAASHRPPVVDDNPLAGLRVLLVDDLPTNCLIAGEILEAFGATVDTAENGVQALHKLLDDQVPCDVVLMDIQMPEMDGLEATRRLRATLRGARLPIIAMTAHALESERERCRAAGMDDFIAKPIDPDLLQQKLLRWRPAPGGQAARRTAAHTAMPSGGDLPELPGIDKAEGLRRMMNKPTLYEKVLRDFHSRFLSEPEAIRAAIDSGDLATAERRAHSTKGLAGTIGAPALQEAAKALETALRERDSALETLFTGFADELRQVTDGIARGFDIERSRPG
jgi:CheY-like chemotaxis protein/HPt (histidine-containing phosphotransfer) domain-containing protein